MGRASRLVGILAVLAGFASAAYASAGAVPELLIIQRKVEKSRGDDPNLEIGDFVAQELQDDGRVSPIYWSMTDSIFRSIVQSGKVSASEVPSLDTAEELAKTMKFAYVMVVEAHTDHNGLVLVRAELYKGEDLVWKDPADNKTLNADLADNLARKGTISRLDADKLNAAQGFRSFSIGGTGGQNTFNTLRSIAHTWVALLGASAFSGLQSKPTQQSPDAIAGPIEKLEKTAPAAPKHADNAQVFKDVEAAVHEGHKGVAILLLREAIDAEPFDLPRREALIKLLNDTGQPELAAQEASRAAGLNPVANSDLKLDVARSHFAAGNLDAAQVAAKDALAHNPKDADAHLILGEVHLFRLDFAAALTELSAAIEIGPVTESLYYRSIAKAFLGDAAGSASDCDSAHHGSLVQPTPAYDSTVKVIDAGMDKVFGALRDLIPSIAINKSSADITTGLTNNQNTATALAAFISSWNAPKSHTSSHERRVLALKLLAQAGSELAAFMSKRDDELLTDARIDFGEAMKQYKAAKEAFHDEDTP